MQGGQDPDCRRAMNWDESLWDHELRNYYKRLIAIRKTYSALTRGSYINLFADSPSGVYAFMRKKGDEEIVVILNNSSSNMINTR